MTITEFFSSQRFIWSSKPLINSLKVKAVKEWSKTLSAIIPLSDKAGRIEYLHQKDALSIERQFTDYALFFTDIKVMSSCPTSNGHLTIWKAWNMPVEGAFVNKNKVRWFVVSPNNKLVLCMVIFILLYCWAGDPLVQEPTLPQCTMYCHRQSSYSASTLELVLQLWQQHVGLLCDIALKELSPVLNMTRTCRGQEELTYWYIKTIE